MALVNIHSIVFHIEGDIGHVQKVIREIFFYDVSFVAAADHKIMNTVRGIHFHDVPQNGPPAYFYHGLGAYRGFLAQSRTKAARKNDCFQFSPIN